MSRKPVYAFDGTSIDKVIECYHQDRSHYGFNCDTQAIRIILQHSNQFEEAEIVIWLDLQYVWIPNSTNLYQWIVKHISAKK